MEQIFLKTQIIRDIFTCKLVFQSITKAQIFELTNQEG